jgi:hypothetical protein
MRTPARTAPPDRDFSGKIGHHLHLAAGFFLSGDPRRRRCPQLQKAAGAKGFRLAWSCPSV